MSVSQLREEYKAKPETAEYFCVSPRSVERWMKQGCPHSHILGKAVFRPGEVERWLEDHGKLKRGGDQK
jgi:phage terminase Nu1 subunit (DNA packaging protein)